MPVLKLSLSLLFAFASLFVATGPVRAQSFDVSNRVTIDDKAATPAGKLYINKNQCNGTRSKPSAEIQIEIPNLSSTHGGASLLEFWVGQSNQDCQSAAGRKPEASTLGKTPCIRVPKEPVRNINPQKQVLDFTAAQLFTDTRTDPEAKCNIQGTLVLFVVPLANETTDTFQGEGIGSPIKFTFTVDFDALAAPVAVRGGSGESQVTVSWNSVQSNDSLMQYGLFFDTGSISSAGGTCTSDLLVEGKELDIYNDDLESRTTKGTSEKINPASLGVELGEQVPSAVVTFDAAGNASLVSNVVCVQRVATSGFWDICNSDSQCADDFNTCSVSLGGGRTRGGFVASTLALLGLALWVRRRRTV